MSEVTVTINGRSYKMSCDDGQERHLLGLAEHVGRHVETLKVHVGQVGDTRLLLMAAIMVADELGEARRRIGGLEEEVQRLSAAHDLAAARLQETQEAAARNLDIAAERIEEMAERLSAGGR
ncbi:MAG: cell division protein ZapA [Hyphomicrobiales bacterium]|nr:cell division protein ZapA [Hyphomicrobiales bacterium]